MDYSFTVNSYIEFGIALTALSTILLLWKFRKSLEVKFLIYFELLVAIWAVSYAFEFGTTKLEVKVLWSQISYFGIAFLPLFYFLFTTAFSQNTKYLKPRIIAILSIIPTITLALALSNPKHHLIWTHITLNSKLNIAIYFHGIWFWVFYAYTQLLIAFGLFNLIRSFFNFTAYYKSQISTLLIGSVFPIVGNFIYISKLNPFPGFDWTPISFVLSGLIIAVGVVRYRMFDLVPLARNKLIDTMEDGVMVINAEGFVEDCNPAIYRIFNFSKKSIIKNKATEVFSAFSFLTKELKHNTHEIISIEIPHKEKVNYYDLRISPILSDKKDFSGNLLLFHDITKLREAEKELKNTNKRLLDEIDNKEKLIEDLDSFAHTVAHDLKNSLGSIYSASDILMDCIKSNDIELLRDLSELIKDSANKTIQITQELLVLATTGHQKVEKIPIKMSSIILETKKQLAYLFEEYEATISIPEKWPIALGNEQWIEEVWKNLISNAIKYGGNPPKVKIGGEKLNNGTIKFWVKDNGNGISAPEQQKLFQKYTRLNPQKAQGYGLGLSIVKRIIEKLDGEVGIESSGKKGEGAIFYFTLKSN